MRKSLFALALAALALAGCATQADSQSETYQSEATVSDSHDGEETPADATEQTAAQTRLALTYDGGVLVLNGESFEVLADIPLEGFTRLNPSGDGRNVMVSTTGGFQVLDMGTWAQAHGDHSHYFTADPTLTDVVFPASEPGHVVSDQGTTTMFDDGTGTIYVLPTVDIAEKSALTEFSVEAHHGVAVPFNDNLLVTKEDRTGATLRDSSGAILAEGSGCESIHGEGVAADSVAFGCADGVLVFHEGTFEKITSPDANGRLGTLVASPASDVILSNYTPHYEGDANEDTITQVALVDLATDIITPVELGTGYSFRSLARGDHGEAIILGADGKLHIIDPESGKETAAYQVVDPWVVPEDWQEPRPAVFVADGTAYVTDPANKKISAVDIESGEIWMTADLPQTVNELTGVTGFATSMTEHDHDEHAEEGHDHEDHDHDHEDEGN